MEDLANAESPAPARFRFRDIWKGPNGLRAGWALLAFYLFYAGVIGLTGYLAYVSHHPFRRPGTITPGIMILGAAMQCCAVLVATLAMSRIERKSWLDYGLRAARPLAQLGQGVFWSLVAISAMMGLLALTHGAQIEFSGASAQSLLESGLLWAVVFALVGINEELTFRGYAFFRLTRGTRPLIAAVVLSLLFGCVHLTNHGETVVGIAQAAAFGLVACLAIWRTGSLWWAIGLHAGWDWGQTFLFGTANSGLTAQGQLLISHATGPVWLSGGTVGPEASVLAFPVMAMVALIAVKTLPRVEKPLTALGRPAA